MRILLRVVAGAVLATAAIRASGGADERIPSMATLLTSRWPSRAAWSPDGRSISFLSTDWTTQNLYVVSAAGGTPVPRLPFPPVAENSDSCLAPIRCVSRGGG